MYQVAKFSRLLAKRYVVAPYAGPGDIVSGAKCFWGLRAYTLALVGNTAIRLRRDSDNAEQDFTTVTGGGLDLTSISSFKSSANLFVVTIYDQLAFDNLSNATSSTQPQFILNGIGAKPVMRFTASLFLRSSSDIQMTQSYEISGVAKRTSVPGADAGVIGDTNGNSAGFAIAANQLRGAGGGGGEIFVSSMTDNNFYAMNLAINGSSSDFNVNGTANTGTITANYGGSGSRTDFNVQRQFVGDATEGGLWDNHFTSTQASNMSANQRAYWGF